MYDDCLIKELKEKSLFILMVSKRDLPLRGFIKKYNNFYYREALDGHEASAEQKKIIKSMGELIMLHKELQENIIDKLMPEITENKSAYLQAGRISDEEALERIFTLSKKYNIENLLQKVERNIISPPRQ